VDYVGEGKGLTVSHTVIMAIFLKMGTAGPYGSRINRKLNDAGMQPEPGHMNPLAILDWICYIKCTYRLRLLHVLHVPEVGPRPRLSHFGFCSFGSAQSSEPHQLNSVFPSYC